MYTIGFRATDPSGNSATGRCVVGVPHNASGAAAVDSGPAHSVCR